MAAVVSWLSSCIYDLQDVLLTSNAYFRYILYVLFTAFIGGFAIELVLSLILSINVKKIILFSPKNFKRYSSGEFATRNTNLKNYNRSRGVFFSRRYNPYALKQFGSLVTSKNFYAGSVKQFSGLSARHFSGAGVRSFSPYGSKNFRVYFSRYFRAGSVKNIVPFGFRSFRVSELKHFGITGFRYYSVYRGLNFRSCSDVKSFVSLKTANNKIKIFVPERYQSIKEIKYKRDRLAHSINMFYKTHPQFKAPHGIRPPKFPDSN